MGFAGRDFDNHKPLWLQTALRWEREDPERFRRWQELTSMLVAQGEEPRAAEKKAWEEISCG